MLNNEEFVKILNNSDNIKIAKSVARLFGYLDKNDIDSETMICMWEAASKFDPSRNVKFTTYFRGCLFWKLMQVAKKQLNYQNLLKRNASHSMIERLSTFEEEIDGVPQHLAKLLRQKYLERKTLKEIGAENGYSYERARILINEALALLKVGV